MGTMLKPHEVFLHWLESDPVFMAEIHDPVSGDDLLWHGGIPDILMSSWMNDDLVPLKCVNIIVEAGDTDVYIKFDRPVFLVECYGPTLSQAWDVYNVLRERSERQFNNQVAVPDGTAYVYRLHMISGGQDVIEPELQWPKVISRWEMILWRETV